jgi:serine/threonine-protein kinase RsbW
MRQAHRLGKFVQNLHLVFAAQPEAVRSGLAQMVAMPPLSDLSDDDRGTAEVVLAEVLNNIAEHAYAGGPGSVAVTVKAAAAGLDCLVVDQGVAMPDNQLPPGKLIAGPDTPVEDLPEGGFGWYLIRTLTQNLSYAREDGCNRLSFTLPSGG